MEAQISLFKIIPIMDGFHQMRVFQRVLFKRYNCLGLEDWFVNSGTITAGSVGRAFEGKQYYRSIRLHKEGFHALFQRKVEDITNKFKLIHPDLISYLSEHRQRHSSKALEYVTIIKE